jgi:tagaturonate reductase
MNRLSFKTLQDQGVDYHALRNLPEKVLQFGTGVLLRALPDYFIDQANKKGIFNGRIVVVKSTDQGNTDLFDEQEGLYTLCLRGVEEGEIIEENVICTAISRVLSASEQWNDIIKCASNPAMEIIISNTTEAGIQLSQDDISAGVPRSFPGKVLAFLYERYKVFNGDPARGMVIVPAELIENNGSKLEAILHELAHLNNLETEFIDWLENSNACCNSLVDRIVPGSPKGPAGEEIVGQLPYTDDLCVISEPFALWAVEGDEQVRSKLTFAGVHPGIIIEPDIEKFKELKLRLLNGTHSLTCGLAILSGFKTVREGMGDHNFSLFVHDLMLSEIALALPDGIDPKAAERFGLQVIDRFKNPYVDHQWLSISLNYTQKMQNRVVPLLLRYYDQYGTAPKHMVTGIAAYIALMKTAEKTGDQYYGNADNERYLIQDPAAQVFYNLSDKDHSTEQYVKKVLENEFIWGQNLNKLNRFADEIVLYLDLIESKGVYYLISGLKGKPLLVTE